jgi:hypothetical protein
MTKPRDEHEGDTDERRDRGDGDVVRPGDRISERDHRIGRKIKREEPSGDEPGYANHDNLPDS